MRFDRSRVAALACAAVGSAAVGAYLLDPAYYDALASRFLGRMSSPEGPSDPSEKNNEKTDSPRTSDIGAIRSLLATTSLREFLAARHVGRPELAPPEDVLVLTPSCTVSEALAKLAEKSVLSAPLLRDDRREILGFVSVGDILGALITHMFPPGPCGYVATTEAPEWFLIDDTPDAAERVTKMVVDKADAFAVPPSATYAARQAAATARGCCWTRPPPTRRSWTSSRRTSWTTRRCGTHTARRAIRLERHSSRRSNHRVAAYERAEDGAVRVKDVFSLSDVTRFLSRWEHIRHCLTPCSVADLGIGTTVVNVIDTNATVLRAFAIMHKLGVSALGVVQPREVGCPAASCLGTARAWPPNTEPVQTRLVGSVSESDLRRITAGHFDVLAMRVGDFVRELHDVSASGARKLAPDPTASARAHPLFGGALSDGELRSGRLLVTCSEDATLFDVLKALTTHRVHRVYAVDDGGVARRVVTHTDLVRFFACFAPTEPSERFEAAAGA
jgi:CBS domain-containing protein